MALTTKAANRKDISTGISEMQHRHFATIAAIVFGEFQDREVYAKEDIARAFADKLRATNPKFDRKRFMLACGTPEE